jgi:hypothetical protein
MSKKCKHEADWHSASVAFRDDEYCKVALPCLHCDECAYADLGPKYFTWNDDDSPVYDVSAETDGAENAPDDPREVSEPPAPAPRTRG